MGLRQTANESSGYPAAEIVFGRHLRSFSDVLNITRIQTLDNLHIYVEDLKQQMTKIETEA